MSGAFGSGRWGCRAALPAVGLILFAAVPVLAQLPPGTILGTVKDPSGAVVPRASIVARNADTGTSRSISTDEAGVYRLAALPVGHYDLRGEAPGFKPTVQKAFVFDVGQETVLNFGLEV